MSFSENTFAKISSVDFTEMLIILNFLSCCAMVTLLDISPAEIKPNTESCCKVKLTLSALLNFRLANLKNKSSLLRLEKIDTVIHFASMTNAEASIKIKKEITENNFISFKNIVNFCIKKRCNLIHISSTSVYGSQEKTVDENCKILKCY